MSVAACGKTTRLMELAESGTAGSVGRSSSEGDFLRPAALVHTRTIERQIQRLGVFWPHTE